MNLKGLATQLECQGVDPGYIQRFDWEKWILTLPSRWSLRDNHLNPIEMKSLVLHLLQEYLRVANAEYVKTLQVEIEALRGDLAESRDALRVRSLNIS